MLDLIWSGNLTGIITTNLYQMKRDQFIKQFAIGGSILLTAPVLFNSCSDDMEDIQNEEQNNNSATLNLTDGAYAALGTVGGYVYKDNMIVIRLTDSNYIALSKICTHQGCDVSYSHSKNELPCPCHGSRFDTSGQVLQGPASTSLKKYQVVKEGDLLKIS